MAKAAICDKCGRCFLVERTNVLHKIRTFKYTNLTYCTNEFDLCDDCMKSFLKWVNEPISNTDGKTDKKTDDNMYGTVKIWV